MTHKQATQEMEKKKQKTPNNVVPLVPSEDGRIKTRKSTYFRTFHFQLKEKIFIGLMTKDQISTINGKILFLKNSCICQVKNHEVYK